MPSVRHLTANPARRATLGWVLYDLANVVFAINIASLYFPVWVVDDAGGSDGDYGLASALSMGAIFLLAPFLGVLADQSRRRLPFLVVSTVLCCALTAFLGSGGLMVSLVLFAVANAVFGCGLIFYDALLPLVSDEGSRGRVSGYGIGAGFGGALLGIIAGLVVLTVDPAAKPVVFRVTALLFLVGSLPCFLWVREPRRDAGPPVRMASVVAEVRATVARTGRYRGMRRFLIGRVFYNDAANTLFGFMSIYAVKEVGFSDLQTQLVLLSGILTGPVGAVWAGIAADRIGPKRALDRLLILWMVVLALCAAIPALGLPTWLFWLVAPCGGVAFGGTGTVDRALLVQLAPPRHVGQFFGLFAMVGRFSAVAGPLLWTATVDWLHAGRPAAVATLAGMVVVSYLAFLPLDDAPRTWPAPDLLPTSPVPSPTPAD